MSPFLQPAHPMLREAWTARAICVAKMDAARFYIMCRLAAVDMPPVKAEIIASEIGRTVDAVRLMLKNMKADGTVDRDSRGRYYLTIPKGARQFYTIALLSTKAPSATTPPHLMNVLRRPQDWISINTITRNKRKKDSWAMRALRDIIQRSSPEEMRELLKEYGMKPMKPRVTAMQPGHTNESRWKRQPRSAD